MWLYLLQGIGYGFAAAAQPGPFQTYLISQSLTRGWQRTLIAAFAPLVSEAPIIALCLFVLSQVPAWFEKFLYIASGLFIIYLAYGAYKVWRNFEGHQRPTEATTQQSLLKAALMNGLSPSPYLFWSLITGPILLQGWRESPLHGIGLLIGFYGTFVLTSMVIIVIFGSMQKFGQKVSRALLGVSAIVLFCFGVFQLWRGLN